MTLPAWTTLGNGNAGDRGEADPQISSSLQARLQISLAARVADPLWFLTRQWQMGEFHGEDAGSPILVEVESEAFSIDSVDFSGKTQPYTAKQAPLEALIERESLEQVKPDGRTRAQAGLLFLQMLQQAKLPFDRVKLLQKFSFSPKEIETAQTLDVISKLLIQQSPDGESICQYFNADIISDSQLGGLFSTTKFDPYRKVVSDWRKIYLVQIGQPKQGDAWLEDRLEYQFSLSIPTAVGRVKLAAKEYHGGKLDWDVFEVQSIDQKQTSTQSMKHTEKLLPSAVTYVGMPAPRWWQLEDGTVDFSNPEISDRDPGRLLLAEFVMAWGNDWFMIPVEIPTGSLSRINSLLVTDTFGVTTRITPQTAQSPNWGMNYLKDLQNWLFIPPVLPVSHQAPASENVLFLRDEMANMVWAIENIVSDQFGNPQTVTEETIGGNGATSQAQLNNELRYQVMTDLPERWIPLVPVRDHNDLYLAKAKLLDEIGEIPLEPSGILLKTADKFRVRDEEIPRAGIQVSRAYQLTRWYDGSRILWVGRRKQMGLGEIRSQLEFDTLTFPSSVP
ncbi:hypothetical protein LC593_11995 [Nostoc sp. CHAB 5844]|nr:hypothetical protein [Nostoc sp. CHAB 5844]